MDDSRALVLGGGGAAGNAWEIGVLAGLADAGVDVTDADLIVGTSAGATVAIQVTGGTPLADLLTATLTPMAPPAGPTVAARAGDSAPATTLLELADASADAEDFRRRLGARARASASDLDAQARRRATVAARLPSARWPDRRVLITAVDAATGEPVVFDRESAVDVVDAVAASTANGLGAPPYRIGDRLYLDGGYRRNENADLARGSARVLVLSPFAGRTLRPESWGHALSVQVDELRAAGSIVETVFPDEDAVRAFGGNMMDLAARPGAARAGAAQGRALAPRLAAFGG